MRRIFILILVCLSLNGCVFLAVRAVKSVMDKGDHGSSSASSSDNIEQVSASSDAIVLKADGFANPDPVADKHCSSYGKKAVQSHADVDSGQNSTTFYYDCQ